MKTPIDTIKGRIVDIDERRGHHTIAHSIGERAFKEKYHIPHGIILDKNLCKVYGLKAKKEAAQEC